MPSTIFRTSLALTAAAGLAGVGVFVLRPSPQSAHAAAEPSAAAPAEGVAMFGHDPSRNMVNLTEKNIPDDWDVQSKANIKWSAKLGSRSYGGPTVAGGKIFVGTNNATPRNPRDARKRKDGKTEPIDKSVLMCFDAATGTFLWQHVNEKRPP